MKKQTLLSLSGIAAAIAIVVVLLLPWNGAPTVQAAMIIQKLSQQIEQSPRFEVTLESLQIDKVAINGSLQASRHAVAGDLAVVVQEGDPDQLIEVDLSLGLSTDGGWVLIRKLTVPDPAAQAILAMVLPAGTEMLILLPEDMADFDDLMDIDMELGDARAELKQAFDQLLASHEEVGATIEHQEDGTVLLKLPIKDAETLAALGRLTEASLDAERPRQTSEAAESGAEVHEEKVEVQIDAEEELIGTTIEILYDPAAEQVRSFSILDLGSPGSRITVAIGEGEIDPALLDSSRVTTPATRTFDIGALKPLLEGRDSD